METYRYWRVVLLSCPASDVAILVQMSVLAGVDRGAKIGIGYVEIPMLIKAVANMMAFVLAADFSGLGVTNSLATVQTRDAQRFVVRLAQVAQGMGAAVVPGDVVGGVMISPTAKRLENALPVEQSADEQFSCLDASSADFVQ